jgi:hypothetical protein
MSSLTSASLLCPCKTAMQNRVRPGVNEFASSRFRCLIYMSMDLFDTFHSYGKTKSSKLVSSLVSGSSRLGSLVNL